MKGILAAVLFAQAQAPPVAPAAPATAARSEATLVEGLGGELQVYQVAESTGADFTDAHCYLLADKASGEVLVIDAGARSAPLAIERARELGLRVALLVSTHFHADHTGGNALVLERTSARMVAPAREAELIAGTGLSPTVSKTYLTRPTPRVDLKAKHGDELKLGAHAVKVIEVPGHSPGGICLHLPNQKLLFTGDALLKGTIGRTGLPHGAKTHDVLVAAIRSRLLVLPDDTTVLPGHGPRTTIGAERAGNPWLKPPAKK